MTVNNTVPVRNWFFQITALHIVHQNKYCMKHFTFQTDCRKSRMQGYALYRFISQHRIHLIKFSATFHFGRHHHTASTQAPATRFATCSCRLLYRVWTFLWNVNLHIRINFFAWLEPICHCLFNRKYRKASNKSRIPKKHCSIVSAVTFWGHVLINARSEINTGP